MKYADMTPEQRKIRNRRNRNSINNYNAKSYDRITIRIRKDGGDGVTLDQIRHAAEMAGMSVNALILDAIKASI